jgi:hypothetical protein
VWHQESCVDYDAEREQVVGLWKQTNFQAAVYVLIPCFSASIACLIIVIFVYLRVPALNNLAGKALVGLCFSWLVMCVCLILQNLDFFDDIRILEKLEDISYHSSGIWFLLLWGNICVNAWYYLPENIKMGQQQELRIFACIVGLFIAFFSIMTAVAIFTQSKYTWITDNCELIKFGLFPRISISGQPANHYHGHFVGMLWPLPSILVGFQAFKSDATISFSTRSKHPITTEKPGITFTWQQRQNK